MGLGASHSSCGIVQHKQRDIGLIVDGVGHPSERTGKKSRVAHKTQMLLIWLRPVHTLRNRKTSAHANTGVYQVKRAGVTERVAADVAREQAVRALSGEPLCRLFDRRKRATVRTPRTEHGRTGREVWQSWDGGTL